MADKVEKFKLDKSQVQFAKVYKRVLKVQKGLMTKLNDTMTTASIVREQLNDVEEMLGTMTQQAPPPFLKELEGQEEARE